MFCLDLLTKRELPIGAQSITWFMLIMALPYALDLLGVWTGWHISVAMVGACVDCGFFIAVAFVVVVVGGGGGVYAWCVCVVWCGVVWCGGGGGVACCVCVVVVVVVVVVVCVCCGVVCCLCWLCF